MALRSWIGEHRLEIIIFLSLYVSLESFLFGINANGLFFLLAVASYALAGLYCITHMPKLQNNSFFILLLLEFWIFASAVINFDFSGGIVLQLLVPFIGYYIAQKYKFIDFLSALERVLYFIALTSIVFYILFFFWSGIFSPFPVIVDTLDAEYRFLILSRFYMPYYGITIIRNASFFREPGVFAIFLTIGLALSLFCQSKVNKKHVIVYTIAVLTTLSTAGIVLYMMLFFIYFITKGNVGSILVLLILGGLFLYIYKTFGDSILFAKTLGKFNSDSEFYGSTISRMASIVIPLNILGHHPIFGAGLTVFGNEFLMFSKQLFHIELEAAGQTTNTVLNLAATYGMVVGLILLYLLYGFVRKIVSHKSFIIAISLFVVFLLALSNEDLRYSIFLFSLLFYGQKKDNLYRELR